MVRPDDSNGTLRLDFTNIVNLGVLPGLSAMRVCYYYAALPLHFLDTGWSLSILGTAILLACCIRILISTPLYPRFGPWVVAPLTVIGFALSIPMAIWPNSLLAVIVGIQGASWTYYMDPYQSLAYIRFDNADVRRQASRFVTLGDTLGYAMSPFVGGVMFDIDGWGLCSIFQVGLCLCEVALAWSSPLIRKDFERWWSKRSGRLQKDSCKDGTTSIANGDDLQPILLPRAIRFPAALIACSAGVNIFVYAVEWASFAAYFRQEFNWRSAWWAGVAQMAGDVLGAVILIFASKHKSSESSDCFLWRSISAPYNISLLLFLWGALHILLASPWFAVVVASQVAMGTVFVFFTQFVVEMNTIYSGGNFEVMLRLQWMSSSCFGLGVATSGAVSLALYENVSRVAPFYMAACFAVVLWLVYTMYFLMRVGFPASLQEFEVQHGSLPSSGSIVKQKHVDDGQTVGKPSSTIPVCSQSPQMINSVPTACYVEEAPVVVDI